MVIRLQQTIHATAVHCGHCIAVCKHDVITVDDLIYTDDIFHLPAKQVDHLLFMNFLAHKRTVRNFRDDPVPEELIKEVLYAHSPGLGASMIGLVPAATNKVREVREIFRIPEDHDAAMSLTLGFPKYRFNAGIKRKDHTLGWVR